MLDDIYDQFCQALTIRIEENGGTIKDTCRPSAESMGLDPQSL